MYLKKRANYEFLVPPLNKPFDELTFQEATDYFEWFVDSIPERIEYLRSVTNLIFDYSPESLITLWKWVIEQADVEKAPKNQIKELKRNLKSIPYDMAETILTENSSQFTLQTEYMLRDVAMYFGEVCVKNNQSIYWGFHTDIEKDSFVNRPLLMGFLDKDFSPPFQAEFDPIFTVRCIAYNIIDGDESKYDLKQIYDKWKRMM